MFQALTLIILLFHNNSYIHKNESYYKVSAYYIQLKSFIKNQFYIISFIYFLLKKNLNLFSISKFIRLKLFLVIFVLHPTEY